MVAVPFPNVPKFPGVPAVNVPSGGLGPGLSTLGLGTTPRLPGDSLKGADVATGFGIFDTSGTRVLEPDNFVALEYVREFRAADHPVEKGGFASYNKVATPSELHVRMTKGGSDADRSAFLDKVRALVETTDLFDIVSPDRTYTRRNFVRQEFKQSAESGATLIIVELLALEIRETVEAAFSNTRAASGATAAPSGPVRPQTPTAAQVPAAPQKLSTAAVAGLPGISALDNAATKLGKIGALSQAGATAADMVAKGVTFQSVPFLPIAAQTISTTLGGQPVRVDLLQKAFGMHANVYVNDALVVGGVLLRNGAPIVRSPYLGFAGELYMHNTRGTSDPTLADLSRFALLYAGG